MSSKAVELGDDVVSALQRLNQPLEQAARECIALELYRRGAISSGKAAKLLGMPRAVFIAYASRLGIAFFEMTDTEWEWERALSDRL
jgi:predicted HTH domain antitoxin